MTGDVNSAGQSQAAAHPPLADQPASLEIVSRSRWRGLFMLACAGIVLTAIVMVARDTWSIWTKLFLVALLLFSLVTALQSALLQLLSPAARVLFDRMGIENSTDGARVIVPWDSVEDVGEVSIHRRRCIGIRFTAMDNASFVEVPATFPQRNWWLGRVTKASAAINALVLLRPRLLRFSRVRSFREALEFQHEYTGYHLVISGFFFKTDQPIAHTVEHIRAWVVWSRQHPPVSSALKSFPAYDQA